MRLQSWWQRRRGWREPDRWWSSSSCRHVAGPLHSTKHPILDIHDTRFKVYKAAAIQQKHADAAVYTDRVLQQLSANQQDVNKVKAILLHLLRKSVSGWVARLLHCWLVKINVSHIKLTPTAENPRCYWLFYPLVNEEGASARWNLSKLQNMRKLHSSAWHAGDTVKQCSFCHIAHWQTSSKLFKLSLNQLSTKGFSLTSCHRQTDI